MCKNGRHKGNCLGNFGIHFAAAFWIMIKMLKWQI